MKRETLKEIGKASLAFGNLVAGLSIVNGLYGKEAILQQPLTTIIIFYIFSITYVAGIMLINKGADND